MNLSEPSHSEREDQLSNCELVIALTYAVGTDISIAIDLLTTQLREFGYTTEVIKISKQLLEPQLNLPAEEISKLSTAKRSHALMDKGNDLRQNSKQWSILASGVASLIASIRQERLGSMKPLPKTAFIIDSLKHPAEVDKLREIYPIGFYLFAINESEENRIRYLTTIKNMGGSDAADLVRRDQAEQQKYGQQTRQVFELADFHVSINTNLSDQPNRTEKDQMRLRRAKQDKLAPQTSRILDLIFGNPFITPTFDEYAMFMAYASGLRSADLARQIGAVITKGHTIIATGANDVPAFGGGQYWPDENFRDAPEGRDYTRGYDSNKRELQKIVKDIVDIFEFSTAKKPSSGEQPSTEDEDRARKAILNSRLKELTEYGRAIHAEMSAIISCANSGISLQGATLYCSTFPCHNCAKHIVGAGIQRVVYIEPYPKSRTLEMYNDSTTITNEEQKVAFNEFIGIGPRRFFDLFSLRLSTGQRIYRKDEEGNCIHWSREQARIRCQMLATSYLDKETVEAVKWSKYGGGQGE